MNRFLLLTVTLMASAAILLNSLPIARPQAPSPSPRPAERASSVVKNSRPISVRRDVIVTVDGVNYPAETRLVNDGTTYVGAVSFLEAVGKSARLTPSDDGTAVLTAEGISLTADPERSYIESSGRYLWCPDGVSVEENELYLPLRTIAAVCGCTVEWDAEREAAAVRTDGDALLSGDAFYNEDDVFWLSRIINAEAGGECFLGKIAVGNVVLNRTRSREFPGTIYEVIFDIRFGVQFSPIKSGSIYKTPNTDSVIAAKLCLDGAVINDEMLYFYNPKKSKSTWMREKCTFVASIGNHDFFS